MNLHNFIDHVKSITDKKILLLMDNHESHVSIAATTKARENYIIMLTVLPHTHTRPYAPATEQTCLWTL
jgi:hypothetical protein